MIKKKIFLCGIGKIGLAHLMSFKEKKNYQFYLYDKYLSSEEIRNILEKKKLGVNYRILKNFPKNSNFQIALIASHSIDRLKVIKNIVKNNKVKFLLLEKFLFLRKNHYKEIKKIFNPKNILINVWGEIIFKILNLKKIKNRKFTIKIKVSEGSLLTNIIHYFYLFFFLTNDYFPKLIKRNIKIIKSKRKNSDEIKGEIHFKSKNKSMIMKTSKSIKNIHTIEINTNKKTKYRIDLPYIKYSNKKKKLFPTCKKVTYLNVKNLNKRKFNNIYKLPKFNDIEKHFLYILSHFNKINGRKIIIN